MTHTKGHLIRCAAIAVAISLSIGCAATCAMAQAQTAPPVYTPNFRPGAMLLRRALPPAPVLWLQARAQAARMRRAHAINTLLSRLPKPEIDRTRLPILLPHEGGTIATDRGRLFSLGDAYALNLPQAKGTQITMYGNRAFVPADAGTISKRPFARLVGMVEDVRIDRTEDGWTATFTRYGVVYSLDVSCDDTASPDCASDSYIRKQITQFDDVAMGQAANGEADTKAAPTTRPVARAAQALKTILGTKP